MGMGASVMLFTLYYFKEYLIDGVQYLITFQATMCVTILLEHFAKEAIAGPKTPDRNDKLWLTKEWDIPMVGELSPLYMLSFMASASIVAAWFFTRNWVLNNFLGICMAFMFLKTIQMTSLWPGTVLLSILFFYDIFWVFLSPKFTSQGRSVMVEVATSLDVPIKLVFPNLNPIMRTDTHAACTMLGLGDIVIPGVFILFTKVAGEKIAKLNGSRVYFWGNMIAYALSLFTCGVVLVVYHAA